MPSWWKGKPKSKSNASSNSLNRNDASPLEGQARTRGKAKSFDGIPPLKKSVDPSHHFTVNTIGHVVGHPLPSPLNVSSMLPELAIGSAASSTTNSGSSDEALDRQSCQANRRRGRVVDMQRQSDVNEDRRLLSSRPAREHLRLSENLVPPAKKLQLHEFEASSNASGQSFIHNEYTRKTKSPSTQSSPTSPVHPMAPGLSPSSHSRRRDVLRSTFHPLPLPPCSSSSYSSSTTSQSPKSHWKKGKLVGRGTFGQVYIGFNSESGQMCAIKEVKVISDDTNSKESLRQLNQEISLLSKLSHPNIVQYYDSELTDNTLSIYIEYVSGGSIHKLLQEYGPFSEPLIRSYTAQILYGLSYLHGRNTVHRDIKGANILVDPNGEIKLADFGMAKHISSYNSIRSFKGSPYWMAPEIITNSNGYNLSVDIWSLGCTLFEMATSKPPWSQFEGIAAIFKIANTGDIPEVPNHLSSQAKDFLRLCLQRDASARPSASQLMNHSFVRDQTMLMVAKHNVSRNIPLSHSERNHTPPNMEQFFVGNLSSQTHMGSQSRQTFAFSPVLKNRGDFRSSRMNMSLPVSPSSSPLRQINRSCLSSPSHPMFSSEAVQHSPGHYAFHGTSPSNNPSEIRFDIDQVWAK